MGITISYKGRLNNQDFVYAFCNELADIAHDIKWDYHILDEDFNKPYTAYVDRNSPVLNKVEV